MSSPATGKSSLSFRCNSGSVPFPFDPDPSMLWSVQLDEKIAGCELRFVPIGVEVRIFRNGNLLMSRIFPNGDQALAWAEEERTRLIGPPSVHGSTVQSSLE
jgi:hypothetical protein